MLSGRRLSFDQAALHGPGVLPSQEVLAAVSNPSVQSFLR